MLWCRARLITCRSSEHIKCLWDTANIVSFRTAESKTGVKLVKGFLASCSKIVWVSIMITLRLFTFTTWIQFRSREITTKNGIHEKNTVNVVNFCSKHTCCYWTFYRLMSDLTSGFLEGQYFRRVFILGVFHSPIFVIPLKCWSFYNFMNTLRITC